MILMKYRELADRIFEAGLKIIQENGINSHAPMLFIIHGEREVKGVVMATDNRELIELMPVGAAAMERPKAMLFLTEAHMAIDDLSMPPSKNPSAVDTFTAWYADKEAIRFRVAVLKETEEGSVEVTDDSGWVEKFGGRFRLTAEKVQRFLS